jgi:hypothetical protein
MKQGCAMNTSAKAIKVGDRVRWQYATVTLRGEVVDISLDADENDVLTPWLTIESIVGNNPVRTRVCGSTSNLKMIKLTVTFRDFYKQLENV